MPSAATFRAPITDLTRLLVIAVPMPPEPPHALGPSQDRSAKAAATAATAAIKACESATAACAAEQPSTLEPVSGQAGLRFPGKVILGDRDRAAITSVEAEREKSRDQVDPTEGADTGYLAPPQEISAVRRVIGGAIRTRTKNPDGFSDGARRDRCAIVAFPATETLVRRDPVRMRDYARRTAGLQFWTAPSDHALCPENSVSPQRRLWFEETGSNVMSVRAAPS